MNKRWVGAHAAGAPVSAVCIKPTMVQAVQSGSQWPDRNRGRRGALQRWNPGQLWPGQARPQESW